MRTKKALLVIGDGWHAPAALQLTFSRFLRPLGYTVESIIDYDIPFDTLNEYHMVIWSKYGRNDTLHMRDPDRYSADHQWITPQQEQQLEAYVEQGGRLFFHHDGFTVYPKEGAITRLAGAYFITHPPIGPITVTPVLPSSAFMKDITEFEIADEEYQLEMDTRKTNVLLESYSEKNGRSVQGWYHRYGEGIVVVFIPGHTAEVLRHPMVNQCIRNVITVLDGDSLPK